MASLRKILTGMKGAAGDFLLRADGLGRPDRAPFDLFDANGLRLACRAEWPAPDAPLTAAWDALSKSAGTSFVSPAWQTAAWQRFGDGTTLRLITVERGTELLAVVPLIFQPERGLSTLGPAVCDYLDPLVRPDVAGACWETILAFCAEQWDRKTLELTFHNLRDASPARTILNRLAPACGFAVEESVAEHCPMLALPATWDAYLDTLDAHERKETRRKLNKAETKGAATFTRCEPTDEITPAIERCLALMEAAGGQKGDDVRSLVRPVLTAAAPQLIRDGRLDLWTLAIHGEPAACLLQFPTPAGPMLFNCGVDYSKKEWSPGVVAVAMAIRNAIAAGATAYDLLRGREPYKYKLGATDRPIHRLTLKRA